jgi:hypothetical protein
MGEARIICAICQVEPQQLTYGNGERELICLACGQKDRPESAIEIASKHATEKRPLRNGFRWKFSRRPA